MIDLTALSIEDITGMDMIVYLQSAAGLNSSMHAALDGWRALSPYAKQQTKIAFKAMRILKGGYKPIYPLVKTSANSELIPLHLMIPRVRLYINDDEKEV
jgi:hypothetical protein